MGQHRLSAHIADHRGDLRIVRGHPDGCDGRSHGALPHMADHRLAGDVGKRLSGKAVRGHAGRNDDNGRGCRAHDAAIHHIIGHLPRQKPQIS